MFSLSSDRGRVVGGLPDVVTIMEEKVRIQSDRLCTRLFYVFYTSLYQPCTYSSGEVEGQSCSCSIPVGPGGVVWVGVEIKQQTIV